MFFSSSVSLDLCAHVTAIFIPLAELRNQPGKGKGEANLLDGGSLAFWLLKDEMIGGDEMKNGRVKSVFGWSLKRVLTIDKGVLACAWKKREDKRNGPVYNIRVRVISIAI